MRIRRVVTAAAFALGALLSPLVAEPAQAEAQSAGPSAAVAGSAGLAAAGPAALTGPSIDDAGSTWLVVNKRRPIPGASAYVPPDLVALPAGIPNPNGHRLRAEAAAALATMFDAARAETGKQLVAQSGFRSYASQQAAYQYYVDTLGQAGADLTSARPGFSEHQTGLAMDILDTTSGCGLEDSCFASTTSGRWLAANAYRFGWILRYPQGQTAITGYEFEPWHYRYVGRELAADMRATGSTTLEQYFDLPPAPSYLASNDPFGTIDSASVRLSQATLAGWAADPDRPREALDIHAYVGGPYGVGTWGGRFAADRSRPDVAAAFPGFGPTHGFEVSVTIPSGTTPVCLYAINVGAGSSTLLSCRSVTALTGSPLGNVESATLSRGTVSLSGWALDPDTSASIDVHVYVNGGWGGAYPASGPRPDVAAVFPANGAAHGFSLSGVRVPVGTSEICVYGIDVAGGHANRQLGCRTVSTDSGPPRGTIDSATRGAGAVTLAGWALDPDTSASIEVHVYVDGGWGGAYRADTSRSDVAAAFPGYGPAHGFRVTVHIRPDARRACVYAINTGPGSTNPLLGCATL